jgi:hypothetical protein
MARTKTNTTIDLDNIEENIRGSFFAFLSRGGVDVNNIQELQKLKHNTLDCALYAVFDDLFKPSKNLPDNKRSLIPYDDNSVLTRLVDVYIRLCNLTDNDSTMRGFSALTGIDDNTLWKWERDELNPERREIVKRITRNRVDMIENKLSDNPIGATALANNSKSLGMMWSRNTAQLQNTKAVYIIPAEKSRPGLPNETRGQITETETENGL